ncbi:UNVERIFIED_CONTAM: hypothetical protein FKN15_063726 [Acipenser sinensis]
MIAVLKADDTIQMPVKVAFVDEAGSDAAGVSREAFTEFWNSFFCTSANGEDVRVPALCPEYGLEEWQAVGRILVKGFSDHKVFPLKLAPAFFIALMFGEEAVLPEELLDSFFLYLSDSDRQVLQLAMSGQLSDDDKEVFEDILDQEGCHSILQMEQVRLVVLQMAHKFLILKSSYALEAMRHIVRERLCNKFLNVNSIKTMCSELKPTPKKVRDLLLALPETREQNQAFRFLTQFI